MSYSSVQRPLGFVEWLTTVAVLAPEGSSSPQCEVGSELGADGQCCPWWQWTNATYLRAKGEASFQYHNEKRVRHALHLLRRSELEGVAWDARLPLGAAEPLASQVEAVSRVWSVLYPPTRWSKHAEAVQSEECGPYSAWRPGAIPRTDAYKRVLAELSHVAPGSGRQVILSVPGGSGPELVTTMPTASQLYSLQGGKVVAKPWTQALLSVFSPRPLPASVFRRASLTLMTEPGPVLSTMDASKLKEAAAERIVSEGWPAWQLAAGAGVLVAGGAGVWWLLRGRQGAGA